VIDDLEEALSLLDNLRASLPISVALTPELRRVLRESVGDELPAKCRVIGAEYAGDPGGIVCRLGFDRPLRDGGLVVSITHLLFRGASPLSRSIATYQKRRTKRIRRELSTPR
jgi:hypothetical protein